VCGKLQQGTTWLAFSHSARMFEAADRKAIDCLAACHQTRSIRDRIGGKTFDEGNSRFTLGGSSWGVSIVFRKQTKGWWCIETIRETSK
jgi:hypothetical protein